MRWIPLMVLVGCAGNGSGAVDVDDSSRGAVTWYEDVGPVLVEKCGSCHNDGGIGPFSMERYEDVAPWALAIEDSILTGRMPPWAATDVDACTPEVPFKDDPRLTEAEKELVSQWVADEAPAGEPVELLLPDPPGIAEPDADVTLAEPFAVSGDRDIYQCFRIEVPHDQDVWITEMEVIPDNDAVVHHVLVWNDPEDQSAGKVGPDGSYPCSGEPDVWPTDLVGGWTPGQPTVKNPEGTGTLFKAGASLVVNVHYHPTDDSTELDQTRIKLDWTTEKPANYVTYYMVDLPFGAQSESGPSDNGGPEFRIPAGKSTHKENLSFDPYRYLPLPLDLPVFAVMPHMHYRGTDMRVTLEHEDGGKSCLINAEGYRFDFQNNYVYDAPTLDDLPTMTQGDVMKVRCTYDNSWENPFMEEALAAAGETDLVDVWWGEETGDEMCMAIIGIVIPPIDLTEWM